MGLAASLREATAQWHVRAERAGLMPRLLRGQLAREPYCALLHNLHALYGALEDALRSNARHPGLQSIIFPELFRQDRLATDLDVLDTGHLARQAPLTSMAAQYGMHLRGLSVNRPELLAAHAYVRYLGDLSGGQLLSAIVGRALALRAGEAVSFYDFGPPEAVTALAHRFREGLDAVVLDEHGTSELTEEACRAFAWHVVLFEQLDAASQPA